MLDIRAARSLTPIEQKEFDEFVAIVKQIDEAEAVQCDASARMLIKKHQTAIIQLERLIDAINEACDKR